MSTLKTLALSSAATIGGGVSASYADLGDVPTIESVLNVPIIFATEPR